MNAFIATRVLPILSLNAWRVDATVSASIRNPAVPCGTAPVSACTFPASRVVESRSAEIESRCATSTSTAPAVFAR